MARLRQQHSLVRWSYVAFLLFYVQSAGRQCTAGLSGPAAFVTVSGSGGLGPGTLDVAALDAHRSNVAFLSVHWVGIVTRRSSHVALCSSALPSHIWWRVWLFR